ncbi:MAG: hypothetical protein EAX96_15495 [Candidatus Lokiarchaeota archaeon]|nr:hypothetical protein [Candidatus Lokiarchaeota archaeon]
MEPIEITIQKAGKERGTRLYINSKDLDNIRKKFGDDFFLFTEKKLKASLDANNSTILISSFDESPENENCTLMDPDVNFLNTIGDDLIYDFGEIDESDCHSLHFFMPVDGTGDNVWVAEVSINGRLAFYCVADKTSELKDEIERKALKHFPGLLALEAFDIKEFKADLVYSPVPGHIAMEAYKYIANKKLGNVEIPSHKSIPNDTELTPIVDMNKGSLNGLKVKSRGILAKFEIEAIANKDSKVKDVQLMMKDKKLAWKVISDKGTNFYDTITGKKMI